MDGKDMMASRHLHQHQNDPSVLITVAYYVSKTDMDVTMPICHILHYVHIKVEKDVSTRKLEYASRQKILRTVQLVTFNMLTHVLI